MEVLKHRSTKIDNAQYGPKSVKIGQKFTDRNWLNLVNSNNTNTYLNINEDSSIKHERQLV